MRIYNARRKLKSLIVAATNSPKWDHPALDTNSDVLSDIDEDETLSSRKCRSFIFLFSAYSGRKRAAFRQCVTKHALNLLAEMTNRVQQEIIVAM